VEHLTGRVVAFDEARGRGEVETESGTRLAFHCTAIADGSRTIPVGTRVRFRASAGPLGRTEASSIAPSA
jgi:cold shock CspA family protein